MLNECVLVLIGKSSAGKVSGKQERTHSRAIVDYDKSIFLSVASDVAACAMRRNGLKAHVWDSVLVFPLLAGLQSRREKKRVSRRGLHRNQAVLRWARVRHLHYHRVCTFFRLITTHSTVLKDASLQAHLTAMLIGYF